MIVNVFVFLTNVELSVSCRCSWLKGEPPGTCTLAACSQKKKGNVRTSNLPWSVPEKKGKTPSTCLQNFWSCFSFVRRTWCSTNKCFLNQTERGGFSPKSKTREWGDAVGKTTSDKSLTTSLEMWKWSMYNIYYFCILDWFWMLYFPRSLTSVGCNVDWQACTCIASYFTSLLRRSSWWCFL